MLWSYNVMCSITRTKLHKQDQTKTILLQQTIQQFTEVINPRSNKTTVCYYLIFNTKHLKTHYFHILHDLTLSSVRAVYPVKWGSAWQTKQTFYVATEHRKLFKWFDSGELEWLISWLPVLGIIIYNNCQISKKQTHSDNLRTLNSG